MKETVGSNQMENVNKGPELRDSIPRVKDILYFQEILQGIAEGATFVATGLYTKHLLEALHERAEHSPIQD